MFDNSCLVYLFAEKLHQFLAPLAAHGVLHDYKAVTLILQKKCDARENKFSYIISLKNISN